MTQTTDLRELLAEIGGYLQAAADGSMSRNNAETLAAELFEDVTAALSRISAVPKGWKLVPVEPTEAMLTAAALKVDEWADSRQYWSAMLSAAPPATMPQEVKT